MDDAMRFRIHGRLQEPFDHEEAAAIMGALTESESFEDRIDRKIAAQTERFSAEINQLYRWTVGSLFAAMTLGVALGQLVD